MVLKKFNFDSLNSSIEINFVIKNIFKLGFQNPSIKTRISDSFHK